MSAPGFANRVAGFGTTIFAEINNLSLKHGAVNLGQGRPDFDGPQEVVEAAIDALRSGKCNQYAPGRGIPELMEGIASHAAAFYDVEVDPENGVLVTPGATEAIFCSIMGLIDPGDEVIVIEPFYDSYVPGIEMAGATPVYVSMHPPDWVFEPEELRAAFNDRTRAIIINTPNNPTGRVSSRARNCNSSPTFACSMTSSSLPTRSMSICSSTTPATSRSLPCPVCLSALSQWAARARPSA